MSLRHCGSVRRVLSPAYFSDISLSLGYLLRALNSQGTRAAYGA